MLSRYIPLSKLRFLLCLEERCYHVMITLEVFNLFGGNDVITLYHAIQIKVSSLFAENDVITFYHGTCV